MNKYLLFVIGGILCCSFGLMVGCGASSELVDVWNDSSFRVLPLHTMFIISVSKTPSERRMWEDAFTAELARHGVAGTPSYRSYPGAVPDTDQVVEIVHSNVFDGILICRRLPPEMKAQYSQGWVALEGDVNAERHTRYDRRWERFTTYYRDINHADCVDSQTVDIRAIDVWATKNDGQMIWSATGKTPEPNSAQEIRPEVVKLVISDLKRKNIIAPKQ